MLLTEPLAQRAKVRVHPLPHSRSVKRHINKQGSDSGKNFQKDEKLIRCVRSLTFRSHVGKANWKQMEAPGLPAPAKLPACTNYRSCEAILDFPAFPAP